MTSPKLVTKPEPMEPAISRKALTTSDLASSLSPEHTEVIR